MEKIIVNGGHNRLVGTVKIEGAKNAVLPLLAATVLASEGVTTLKNVPVLSDVFTMNNVVRGLNAQVTFNEEENTVVVDAREKLSEEAPYKYVSKMRASIVVLGPVLARNGHAKVSMPGGCTIGSRPIDLHLKGLEAMGAEITQTAGYIFRIRHHVCGRLRERRARSAEEVQLHGVRWHDPSMSEVENISPDDLKVDFPLVIVGARTRGTLWIT